MLKPINKWVLGAAVAFACPLLAGARPASAQTTNTATNTTASTTCDAATLHGTYVYAYTGYTTTSESVTRFAVAGLAVFNGDGTLQGVSTTATEGQAPAVAVSYKGTYTSKPDCTATETDTDQNGNVTHFDDFTGPAGNTISYVEVDPDVVSSGVETRQSTAQ